MQPRRWQLMNMNRTAGLPQTFNSVQLEGNSPHVLLHRTLHHNYDNDFIRSEDEIDSSPSPPERIGDRAPAFSTTSYPFQSSAVQPYLNNNRSFTPEYTPSPIDYTIMQVHLPQGIPVIDHSHHNSGEFYSENSITTMHGFRSHHDTQIDNIDTSAAVGRTQQKSQALRLRPVSELPDMFRSVFKFGVFNAIQSTCFEAVLHSNENLVISAPTGSGKTVLFELSIIRMVSDPSSTAKCIYVAPTKALCTEKYKEWTSKFGGLGIHSCELTGDTMVFGKGVWGDAKNARIIVTTAEKWDSLTRNWDDHSRILSQIKLFLVDEVHILNESRGSTLEVVVSRMKARGSDVRFVLVSATVPNIEDVASWIGSNHTPRNHPGQIFQFGDEYRPCKLSRFVYGVSKSKGQNDFAYAHNLDTHLFSILQQHAVDKPILVFCPTRKGTITTARQLAREYEEAMKSNRLLPWSRPLHMDQTFHDKDLASLASLGIGVHHAGLTIDDRKTVEDLYLRKVLRVLLATSTLAVGVNLPAHLVVIKGVKLYQNGESKEYSDLDIMQMMGRAGRPQFDTEGVAIIMCETELEGKYRDLVQGTTPLESSLHMNLTEHLNSEIGLGTITNVKTAQEWLLRSFLYCRIQKNSQHYDIGKDDRQSWQEKVEDIVMDSIEQLRESELITYSPRDGELSSTEFGDIMSKFYIRRRTMKAILDLSPSASLREIFEMISASEELSDLKLRSGEKQIYEKIRRHNDIRFSVKKVQSTSDKVFLLMQAVLGGLPLNSAEYKSGESQPCLEAFSVFRHVTRIATAVAEVAIIKKNGAHVKHGLELVRCFHAKAWEDRPIVLRQLEHVGEKSIKILAENHISSIPKLLSTSPLRLEELLNRRSPFGFEVLAAANELPKYFLGLTEVNVSPSDGKSPVNVELSVDCGILSDKKAVTGSKKQKRSGADITTLLTITSDLIFIDFRRISTKALRERKSFVVHAQLTKPSQTISVSISSDKIAGIVVTESYKPSLPANKYPTFNTRPLTSLEMDLDGLEDVADFWDMGPDDDDNIPMKDLTQPRSPLQSNTSAQKISKFQTEKVVQSASHSTEKGQKLNTVKTPVRDIEPHKRSDGKYDCNHTCKDKSACRHMCCRDGLTEPSRVPRKKNNTKPVYESSSKKTDESSFNLSLTGSKSQVTVDDVPIPERRKVSRRNAALEQLDSLHTGADVNRRLQLSQGKRLKLVASTPSSSKRKPNFDIELATLKCSQSPTSKHVLDNMPSDDDLPNVSELLGERKHVRSTTDSSNFDGDALIRGDNDNEITMHALSPTRKQAFKCDTSTTALPPHGSHPRKRLKSGNTAYRSHDSPRRDLANDEQKRFKADLKLFGSFSDILDSKVYCQSAPSLSNLVIDIPDQSANHQSLFLAESCDADIDLQPAQSPFKASLQQPSDDFSFDESYFDILPDAQQASGMESQATSKGLQLLPNNSRVCLQSGVQVSSTNAHAGPVSFKRTSSLIEHQQDEEMRTDNNLVDVLAEFESWLESAVDIVS